MSNAAAAPEGMKRTLGLALGSVGVVYGDIGTSPLYAFRESIAAATHHGGAPLEAAMILGVLSLILWSLIVIVTLKYVFLLLRADNQGEGGILSLMALTQGAVGKKAHLILFGMLGAALFYGDAMITPAISVLSAIEGLGLVTHQFDPFILPIALVILIGLFAIQARGTEKVSRFFGPIMVLWFLAIAAGGLYHINDNPIVWQALNPYHAFYFLTHYGWASVIALGAVLLAVTGAEALYADLGHFGRKPIQFAWLWFVLPSLALNYIGQAALLLSNPAAASNSFFLLYPDWALLPMVVMATLATIIAGQAVITGAFSLTHQAIQLGFLPRLHVQYTSERHAGQIYIPQLNWLLLIGVLLLVAMFRTSSNLAAAYGIAVVGTMIMSSLLAYVATRHVWHWPKAASIMVVIPLLLVELAFFGANVTKIPQGGYMPLVLSMMLLLMMRTWVRGSEELHQQMYRANATLEEMVRELNHFPPKRVEGTAVFLTASTDYAPAALLHNLKHNKVLHESNILMTLEFTTAPTVENAARMTIATVPGRPDFLRVTLRYGFMEQPNVLLGVRLLRESGVCLDMMSTSFFISRRNIVPSSQYGMPLWQDRIYIAMASYASDPADYFHIPRSRVVELGVQMTV